MSSEPTTNDRRRVDQSNQRFEQGTTGMTWRIMPEYEQNLPAHRAACLAVVERAIYRASSALENHLLQPQQAQALFHLLEAVRNLPRSASGDAFWTEEWVRERLAKYDAHSECGKSLAFAFSSFFSLQEIYCDAFESALREQRRRTWQCERGAEACVPEGDGNEQ